MLSTSHGGAVGAGYNHGDNQELGYNPTLAMVM